MKFFRIVLMLFTLALTHVCLHCLTRTIAHFALHIRPAKRRWKMCKDCGKVRIVQEF